MPPYIFQSARLGFRQWQSSDLEPFARMNADPVVMEFFPSVWTYEQSQDFITRITGHFDQHGFGWYAVDKLEDQSFMGFIGFKRPGFKAHFTPCIEIGWRLTKEVWNKGYATEGATRCLEFGFETLNFSEVYSFTSTLNLKSERIMQKIGMKKTGEFEHPLLDADDKLRLHVLYHISKNDGWPEDFV